VIPLTDVDRSPLQFPIVTVSVVGANVFMFFLELIGGDAFILRWSLIPSQITAGRDLITLLTAMFMHGGWLHIVGNMVFLWAFGPEVEDAMGRARYVAFYLLGGLIASFAQVLVAPSSTTPNLGASGAIAAVMGAFLITYPRDRIKTLLMIGFFVTVRLVPAVVLVGLWFITQLFSEVGAVVAGDQGGIAYMAHIGGFAFGALAARLFEPRRR